MEAQPFGGELELNEFICNEMIYPEKAFTDKIEGTVIISFSVETNGTVKNVRVVSSVCKELDFEAMRVFNKSLWKPALKMGKPFPSNAEFSFKFSIRKYKKSCKKRGYNTIEYPHMPVDTSNQVFTLKTVNKSPGLLFKNKKMNLQKFISENLKYPEAAFRQNISGIAKVRFVVEPYGKISHVFVENSLGGGCSQEAIRIVKLLSWYPGLKDDKAVRTWMEMEISFLLPDSQNLQYVPNNPSSAY